MGRKLVCKDVFSDNNARERTRTRTYDSTFKTYRKKRENEKMFLMITTQEREHEPMLKT